MSGLSGSEDALVITLSGFSVLVVIIIGMAMLVDLFALAAETEVVSRQAPRPQDHESESG